MFDKLLKRILGANSEFNPSGPWLDEITERGFLLRTRYARAEIRDPKLIKRITIVTNDQGPFREDIFWKFEHPDGDFYFPSAMDRGESMLEFFQDLNGFDNEKVIEAMSCAENRAFVVWDRNDIY